MQLDIRGKVIAITGAGRGLGRALALGLAREGARVAVMARDGHQAAGAVQEISAQLPGSATLLAVAADVADEEQVRAAATTVYARWGRIDALVNNAAWLPPRMNVLDLTLRDLHRAVDSNLIGCFLTTKHFAPIMIRGGGGRIIYMTSMVGVQAHPGQSAYGATKAGLITLANVVHQELGGQGIRTTALAPGLTDTPGMRASVDEGGIAQLTSGSPDGRLAQPHEVVPLAAFLCSDAANLLSGALLPIRPFTG